MWVNLKLKFGRVFSSFDKIFKQWKIQLSNAFLIFKSDLIILCLEINIYNLGDNFLRPRTKISSIPFLSRFRGKARESATPYPAFLFCFNRDGWRRGWNLEKYHGREIKRNGWHDIHWPDRYAVSVGVQLCVCARTKTGEGVDGEMSGAGGNRWNVTTEWKESVKGEEGGTFQDVATWERC